MKFNVSEILLQKIGFVSSLNINDQAEIDGQEVSLVGKGKLLRTDKGIWVSVFIETKIDMECVRCLNKFPFDVDFNIEEEVFPVDEATNQRAVETDRYAGISLIDANNILDISDMVVQYIDINMPINGNCDVQCKGLCVECGINLNSNMCKCETGSMDDGWNILSSTRIIERKQEK
jgi:uncharacterized protein